MPLRSLPIGGSCPDTAACPSSCRLHAAVSLPPTSTPTFHPEMPPPPASFVALRATTSPVGCSVADTASAHSETRSSTASLRSQQQRLLRHPPVSFPLVSRPLARLSAAPQHDLPGREWPSASPPLLSPCSSAPPSTHSDKNAPRTAATALPDKIHQDFPLTLNTCRRQTTAPLSARALSGAAEMPSNLPCLPSTLPTPPVPRGIPLHLRQWLPAAIRSAPHHPSSASATSHLETHTGGCPRSAGSARSRSARKSSGSAR